MQACGTEQRPIEQVPFQTVDTLDEATHERVEVDHQEKSDLDEYRAGCHFGFFLSKDHKFLYMESSLQTDRQLRIVEYWVKKEIFQNSQINLEILLFEIRIFKRTI